MTDPKSPALWSKAMLYPSATEMKWQTEFFAAIEWWRLVPLENRVKNNPTDPLKRVAFAKTFERDMAVAYLPDETPVEIELQGLDQPLFARWFDHTTGKYTEPVPVPPGKTATFTPPKAGDWVLLLLKKQ